MRPAASTRSGTQNTSRPHFRRFHYRLCDVAGREVDVLDRAEPLRVDETITLHGIEAWRVVAVLGASATVAHAEVE